MDITIKEMARFNARLSQEQKQSFEKAALLGGYRNLTDFVILTAQEKAKTIIEEKEQVIASERDSKIFFEAVTKAAAPNKALKTALKGYNAFTSKAKINA